MNTTSSNFFFCLVAERTVAFKNKKPKGRIVRPQTEICSRRIKGWSMPVGKEDI